MISATYTTTTGKTDTFTANDLYDLYRWAQNKHLDSLNITWKRVTEYSINRTVSKSPIRLLQDVQQHELVTFYRSLKYGERRVLGYFTFSILEGLRFLPCLGGVDQYEGLKLDPVKVSECKDLKEVAGLIVKEWLAD